MKNLRILLADDHEIVRHGLRAFLLEQRGWIICGEATTGREAVTLAQQLRPDVVVMDLSMPQLNGFEATRQIRATLPDVEVLILTMHASEELAREVLDAGARGFVLKSDAGKCLVAAVSALARHEPFLTTQMAGVQLGERQSLRFAPQATTQGSLTTREREIVQLIAEGNSTKELASLLGIAVKTAETHRANILRKLGLRSVSDVVRYAIRNRIAEP